MEVFFDLAPIKRSICFIDMSSSITNSLSHEEKYEQSLDSISLAAMSMYRSYSTAAARRCVQDKPPVTIRLFTELSYPLQFYILSSRSWALCFASSETFGFLRVAFKPPALCIILVMKFQCRYYNTEYNRRMINHTRCWGSC
jgi:hypothetical protein